MNLRLKHIDQEPGRSAYHLYGNFGENFPANDTDIGCLPFFKKFPESPIGK